MGAKSAAFGRVVCHAPPGVQGVLGRAPREFTAYVREAAAADSFRAWHDLTQSPPGGNGGPRAEVCGDTVGWITGMGAQTTRLKSRLKGAAVNGAW
ncbi:hypothetical protein AB0933_34525 [Streptomyces venezuelae]|uniref:hypothetical protein n=1 Tax=Streptomyces venezuelae TaxID=54571 RepID=UPI003454D3B5